MSYEYGTEIPNFKTDLQMLRDLEPAVIETVCNGAQIKRFSRALAALCDTMIFVNGCYFLRLAAESLRKDYADPALADDECPLALRERIGDVIYEALIKAADVIDAARKLEYEPPETISGIS